MQELVPWNISLEKKEKENVDLRHATNDTQVEGRVVAFVSRWIFHHLSLRHHLDEILRPRPSDLPALPFCFDGQIIGRKISGSGLIWQLTASLHHVHYYAQVLVPI